MTYKIDLIERADMHLPYVNVSLLPPDMTLDGRLKVEVLDISEGEMGSVEGRIIEILEQNNINVKFIDTQYGRQAIYHGIDILTLTKDPESILKVNGKPDHLYAYLTVSGRVMAMPYEIASKAVDFGLLTEGFSPLIQDNMLPADPIKIIYGALKK